MTPVSRRAIGSTGGLTHGVVAAGCVALVGAIRGSTHDRPSQTRPLAAFVPTAVTDMSTGASTQAEPDQICSFAIPAPSLVLPTLDPDPDGSHGHAPVREHFGYDVQRMRDPAVGAVAQRLGLRVLVGID